MTCLIACHRTPVWIVAHDITGLSDPDFDYYTPPSYGWNIASVALNDKQNFKKSLLPFIPVHQIKTK